MASQPIRNHLLSLCFSDLRDHFRDQGSQHPVLVADEFVGAGDPLLPGSTTAEVAAMLLLTNLVKKFEDETSEDATSRCILAFLESDYGCSLWKVPVQPKPPMTVVSGRLRHNEAYQGLVESARWTGYSAIKACLRDTFCRPTPLSLCEVPGFDGSNPWSWENIFLMGDVGPGASIDATGTSWLDKFYLSPISFANQELLEAYQHCLGAGTLRSVAENQRRAQYGFTQVLGGVFGSVPKSFNVDRSIETQPALEMWAQKGIAAIAEQFVRAKYGVDLAIQPEINRELARRGSIDGTLATFDLTEASNRIPWSMIEDCLAGLDVLGAISSARVSKTRMPWGEYIDLNMCSTMGNGFTFILQTAVFLAVVEAAFDSLGLTMAKAPRISLLNAASRVDSWVKAANPGLPRIPAHVGRAIEACAGAQDDLTMVDLPTWGVFGDDIIVASSVRETLKFYLDVIGALVNSSKSFEIGPFRESCGGDFYNGVNVRAVYCRSLKLPQDKISLINRLNVWTANHGIPLRRTCSYLVSGLKEKLLVPLHEAEDAGIRCPSRMAPSYPASKAVLQVRKDLQRACIPYRYYKARPYRVMYSGRQLVIYGPGLLLSMLKGETASSSFDSADPTDVRGSAYSLALFKRRETDKALYDARWGVSYDWDASPGNNINVAALGWAVSVNLDECLFNSPG